MSLSVTLASAMSGLQANARAAELVSTNIANALTDGYGRREIQLQARSLGGSGSGVAVTGLVRISDQILVSDRRIAQANAAGEGRLATFLAQLEATIGTPETEGSLGQRIAALDAGLLAASSRPDSEARLAGVLAAAADLAAHLRATTTQVQDERGRADDRIATQVADLNKTLAQVAEMNARILKQVAADRDASPLMDQRQQLVDRIASIVPIRETNRDNGQIALVTTGGAVLVDAGRAATFGFTPAGIVSADMTVQSGALSGLTINGKPVTFGDGNRVLDGGTLAADFGLRDREAVALQAQLDGLSRDLVGRFSNLALDDTLAPGAPGLFTDAGAAFDPLTEIGLAGRISINAAADPTQGGALWRLRDDGLGAPSEGPPGASARLEALRSALSDRLQPASSGFGPGARSLSGLATDVLSRVSAGRVRAEAAESFAAAKQTALRSDELAQGVDSDQQVQELLLVERAYAANARVIAAVDEMLKILLGI